MSLKTLEDWKTAYYEQQARFTESNGILTKERDDALRALSEAQSQPGDVIKRPHNIPPVDWGALLIIAQNFDIYLKDGKILPMEAMNAALVAGTEERDRLTAYAGALAQTIEGECQWLAEERDRMVSLDENLRACMLDQRRSTLAAALQKRDSV